jgi:hypothetical protein
MLAEVKTARMKKERIEKEQISLSQQVEEREDIVMKL